MKKVAVVAALSLSLLLSRAHAEEVAREQVAIPAGKTEVTLKGQIRGYSSHEYTVDAQAGQVMSVKLAAKNSSTYFNVFSPGKKPGQDEAIFRGDVDGATFSESLKESGGYLVQVYLYRNAARRNEVSDYTVSFEVKAGSAGTAPEGDFADGLSGGPDFWEVTGLAAGKTVNLRSAPSASSQVVDRLGEGTILRNKGCRMEAGKRWCNVERREQPSIKGWVAGQFLREASVAGDAPSGDALVPGTNYHAVGRIPCKLDGQPEVKDCEFGVTRGSSGVATIFITLPNKFIRVLSFDNGKISPQSAVTDFSFTRDQDNTVVKVNGLDETYTIPDAVIFGG